MRPNRSTLAGIALVCFANLLLSILVTRLFSATMFYHFTFMAVGLAMFGIAASGVYVFLNADKLRENVQQRLATNARWFALATLVTIIYTTSNPIFGAQGVPDWSPRVFWQLVMMIVFTALPFFFAGVVVSLALTFFREDVNRVYFYDLAGAAAAAMVTGILLGVFGGVSASLLTAALALVAAALFEPTRSWKRWLLPALGMLFLLVNIEYKVVQLATAKWEQRILFEKWNAFSRITVERGNLIMIDAGASTQIEDRRKLAPNMSKNEITAIAGDSTPLNRTVSATGSPP